MKKSRKVFLICLVVASCLFLSSMNIYAADVWWTARIDQVTVKTSPSLIYIMKVTNVNGPWTFWVNFTNKEMLAVALTAYSMGLDVLIKYDNVTGELNQINLQ